MKIIADLHVHSHFSRATSPNLTFEHLTRWAQLKGIQVVGTGDIAHPGWLQEMKQKLEPAEEGLFRLKPDDAAAVQAQVPPACQGPVRFMLAGEISNIYKRGDKTRKIHNLVFAPSFEALERLQARLEKIGNIRSDGRPILGLDSRDLLEIVLGIDPACHLIPAHIWTPWFSLLGSRSGFDSVEECFGDLTSHIFAVETGLSSDPPMNWRVSALDRFTLVSNSDAHSPEKLGREATLFDCELAYGALFEALMDHRRGEAFPGMPPMTQMPPPDETPASTLGPGRNASPLLGTVEFFPEEGKYHFDGHRACGIAWDPKTTLAHNGICPVCGKPVTVGVMHRVEALADRPEGGRPARTHPFHSLVPLPEVLGEVYGVGAGSRQVEAEYAKLLARLGPELSILRDIPLEEIIPAGGERLAEGIGRMRRGEVVTAAGYDGEYGVVRVFGGAAKPVPAAQMGLFGQETGGRGAEEQGSGGAGGQGDGGRTPDLVAVAEAPADYIAEPSEPKPALAQPDEPAGDTPLTTAQIPNTQYPASILETLNEQQRAAVLCTDAPLIIVAGPGTGKTRTLTVRIAYLILEKHVAPEAILAITFTNKAAGEMAERLEDMLGSETASRITIKTFHALGASLLREHAARLGISPDFAILTDEDRAALLRQACPELKGGEVDAALAQISAMKNANSFAGPFAAIYRRYKAALRAADAVDFDDLIGLPIRLLETHPDVLTAVRARYQWISVDEYQDVNLAQYRLLRLLTVPVAPPSPQSWGEQTFPPELGGRGASLCVIGDPDQAIYGFRGADRRYFLQFEQDYPGARTLTLNRNYRSTQLILDAAMQVITRRGEVSSPEVSSPTGEETPPLQAILSLRATPPVEAVQVLADFADQVKLDVYRAPTDRAEAEYVVHQIEQMVGGTSYFSLDSGRASGETLAAARSFADFAVLYRLSAQSRLLVEAFDRSGIPYQTVGQTPLTAHKAVREVLAWLWLLHNPRSQAHLKAVSAVGGFDKLSYDRWLATGESDRSVARLIEQVTALIAQQRRKPHNEADAERLHQLALRAAPFGDRLADFLESTALQSETDAYDPRADRVALMTLHAAKGLEFPVVFIVGCEEGLLPYERVARSETGHSDVVEIEEERRLFYVGLTRARNKLVLTHARTRFLYGQRLENPPSRFVGDIEAALKEMREMQHRPTAKKREDAQLSLF